MGGLGCRGWVAPAVLLCLLSACGDDASPMETPDAGPEPCRRDSDCDDGVFCNGTEV